MRKALLDKREYRFLKLPSNGLRVVLVTDSEAEQEAAALRVNVGHMMDPEDNPGIAHFCEHMCFLGSSKFPEVGSQQEYMPNRQLLRLTITNNSLSPPLFTTYLKQH